MSFNVGQLNWISKQTETIYVCTYVHAREIYWRISERNILKSATRLLWHVHCISGIFLGLIGY